MLNPVPEDIPIAKNGGREYQEKKRQHIDDYKAATTPYSDAPMDAIGAYFHTRLGTLYRNRQTNPRVRLQAFVHIIIVFACFGNFTFSLDNLIAPILWTVIHSLPDVAANTEQKLNGERVNANAHFLSLF